MYTIRRTATIVVVAVGLAATSAGLASAAGGELADTAPTTPAAAAFPAAPGAAAGAARDHAGSASGVVGGDEAGSAWCSTHRLAVVAFGETWFGGVHVGSVCDHPRP